MALLLLIETSSDCCSIAVARDEKIISIKESKTEKNHASVITVFIDEAIKESGISFNELDAVAINGGPGSYTGLRIGLSAAKGLCYALNKPLIMIDALMGLRHGVNDLAFDFLCCTIDNRRDEFFYSLFDMNGIQIIPTALSSIKDNSFLKIIDEKKILFVGSAALVVKNVFGAKYSYADAQPSAKNLVTEASKKFMSKNFSDLVYSEPFYMKEVYITKEK
jgi:tRNA threonylcarbamoyladenosine biosynthesis protein TsaB